MYKMIEFYRFQTTNHAFLCPFDIGSISIDYIDTEIFGLNNNPLTVNIDRPFQINHNRNLDLYGNQNTISWLIFKTKVVKN